MNKKLLFVFSTLLICSFSFGNLSKKVFAGTAGHIYFDESPSPAPSGVILSFCEDDSKGLWKVSGYDSVGVPMLWMGHFDYELDKNQSLVINLREGEMNQKGTEVASEIKEFFEDYFGSNPVLASMNISLEKEQKESLNSADEQWIFLGDHTDLKDVELELIPYRLSENVRLGKIAVFSEKSKFFSELKYVVLEDMKKLPRNSVPFN